MSRPLRIAFCGEGSSDSRIVPTIIEKIIRELTPAESFDLQIITQNWDTRRQFPDAFVNVVRQAQPLYHVLVAHLDADGPDDRRVREHKIAPAEMALANLQPATLPIVWAVPVQAIEAWLLVSAEAFATTLTGRNNRANEIDLPAHPERLHRDEAKRLYAEYVYTLLGRSRRQRKRIDPGRFQADVAEETPLDVLRRLPAFRRFEDHLSGTLIALGYVSP
jgi:hypothetical protein